ncbi:MAG: PTS sugar transporter subunit IIB [Treponema sp.]|jgi:PTS system cellobiose-specific IIB component|nr:PTS sugar transporter subunit IIB [Treponema sp.]
MDKVNVLLVCGSGASTGFMAANLRKEAGKQGLDWEIAARSETEIESFEDAVNCIMLGPHLEYLLEDLTERYKGKNVKVAVMDKSYYSILDGAAALKHIQSLY